MEEYFELEVDVAIFLKINKINLKFQYKKKKNLTILLNVFIGCLKVSLILRAGAFFGLELGVCTAQHLMKNPINMKKMIDSNTQKYQFSIIYCFNVCSVSLLSSKFLSLTKGPSASTARHLRKTSQ